MQEWKTERFEDMVNNCFRCHKEPYETDATHWHYCNDCVKTCIVCKELKVLWAFNFDFKSEEYKRYHEDKYGFMNASGHMDICVRCENEITAAIMFKKPKMNLPAKQSTISQNQLELMLKAVTGRTTEGTESTEPPDSAPTGT